MKISELFNVSGKVAVVTGGSRGIGEMISAGFLANGVKVYITARKEEPLVKKAEELSNKYNGVCIPIACDLSSSIGIDYFVKMIHEKEKAIGDQLTSMFADTEYDEDAENNFSGMSFQYEDYYDEEDQTSDLPQAEERLDDIIRDANDTAEHVSFGGQIEEGWDDMPWYVSVHCAYSFELQIDPTKVDEIPDTNNWSESRGFRNDFVNIFENFVII